MVLTCIKNLVFPTRREGEYQRLLDAERGHREHSVDSGTTINAFNDKNDNAEGRSLLKCRINPRIVSDATIGLSDGLTVPFALTAGLSALGTTDLVIYAGYVAMASSYLAD